MSEPLRLLSPQIGIVTTIGDDHYAAFRTREATALEKGKLVECLPPEGTAILNADDPLVRGMAERTRARVMTYGCERARRPQRLGDFKPMARPPHIHGHACGDGCAD